MRSSKIDRERRQIDYCEWGLNGRAYLLLRAFALSGAEPWVETIQAGGKRLRAGVVLRSPSNVSGQINKVPSACSRKCTRPASTQRKMVRKVTPATTAAASGASIAACGSAHSSHITIGAPCGLAMIQTSFISTRVSVLVFFLK